jgi:hypothetical protein
MTALPPGVLEHLLKTLPPERDDPFPHLAILTPDQLLLRRIELSAQLKTLEEERHAIDAELQSIYSDPELRFGVRAPGGWVLRSRSRTKWDYAPEIRDAINTLQQQAKRNSQAEPLVSSYLCLVQEI